jgi:hypothetical protein
MSTHRLAHTAQVVAEHPRIRHHALRVALLQNSDTHSSIYGDGDDADIDDNDEDDDDDADDADNDDYDND